MMLKLTKPLWNKYSLMINVTVLASLFVFKDIRLGACGLSFLTKIISTISTAIDSIKNGKARHFH